MPSNEKKAAAGGKGLQCKGGRGEGWCQYIEIETTALAGCKSVTTAGGGGAQGRGEFSFDDELLLYLMWSEAQFLVLTQSVLGGRVFLMILLLFSPAGWNGEVQRHVDLCVPSLITSNSWFFFVD